MCTISVIVPVYKVEAYLPRCIDSILHQTFADFELILVDDGSPDGCGKICDEYAQRDARVRVLHQENAGLSMARNAGLDVAGAEYVTFVDSDDYVSTDMLEKLYRALVSTDADMSICNCLRVAEDDREEASCDNTNLPVRREVVSPEKILKEYNLTPKGWYFVTAWGKLYKKPLFAKHRYEAGRWHEDELIIHKLYLQCHKIACIPDALYYYVMRNDSITCHKFCAKHLDNSYARLDRADCLIKAGFDAKTIYRNMMWAMDFMHEGYATLWGDPEFMRRYHENLKIYRELLKKAPRKGLTVKEKMKLWLTWCSPHLTYEAREIVLKSRREASARDDTK